MLSQDVSEQQKSEKLQCSVLNTLKRIGRLASLSNSMPLLTHQQASVDNPVNRDGPNRELIKPNSHVHNPPHPPPNLPSHPV